MEVYQHYRMSLLKLLLTLLALFLIEYLAIKVLFIPYEELKVNANKWHPSIAYIFFGPFSILVGVFIVIFVKFLFKSEKGLILTKKGIIDNTSPLSFGEIPFENISSICSVKNIPNKFRFLTVKTNYININLKKQKINQSWWQSKGVIGFFIKRMNSYMLQTRFLNESHQNIFIALKLIAEQKNIKVVEVDYEK